MLSACSRFIGVGRLLAIYRSSTFLFFYRHEFHPAFRAISRMPRRRSPCRPKAGLSRRSFAKADARHVSAVRSPCGSPTAQVRSRLWLKCVFAFRLVVGQAPRLPAGKWQPERLPYKQYAIATALRQERRSVSEKALLQDQFSERKCAGWSSIE